MSSDLCSRSFENFFFFWTLLIWILFRLHSSYRCNFFFLLVLLHCFSFCFLVSPLPMHASCVLFIFYFWVMLGTNKIAQLWVNCKSPCELWHKIVLFYMSLALLSTFLIMVNDVRWLDRSSGGKAHGCFFFLSQSHVFVFFAFFFLFLFCFLFCFFCFCFCFFF